MTASALRQPSGWLPIVMSLAAMALVIGHVAMFGIVREADEGTAAHLFQFLMAGQIPIVAHFVIKWAPRFPHASLRVLALQAAAALAAFASVYWLT